MTRDAPSHGPSGAGEGPDSSSPGGVDSRSLRLWGAIAAAALLVVGLVVAAALVLLDGDPDGPASPAGPDLPTECPSAEELEAAFRQAPRLAESILLGGGFSDIDCEGPWVRAFATPVEMDAAAVYFTRYDGQLVAVDGGTGITCDDLGIEATEPAARLC